MPMGERRSSRSGQETRDRIVDAALETVRCQGLVGTSVRAIARTGGFNQALVFYHFGSVEELMLAALERANERRMVWLQERLEAVESLHDLVRVAIDLHQDDAGCDQPALTAIVAGWSTTSEMGPRILEILRPWDELVAGALERSLAGSPFAQALPVADMAQAASAMFLGIQLLSRLDPEDSRTATLFSSLAGAASLAEPLMGALAADRPAADGPAPAAGRAGRG